MNVKLWRDILENICDRTHSQYGMVAIIRAVMIIVNKEIWKAFLECRFKVINKESAKRKNREVQADEDLKKKQKSARDQCIGLIGEEFTRKWEAVPTDLKIFLAGMSKEDFAKQSASINSFNVGSSKSNVKTTNQKMYQQLQYQQKIFSNYLNQRRIHNTSHLQNNQLMQINQKSPTKKILIREVSNRPSFSKISNQLNPEDQHINLEVKLTLILLILPP